MAGDRPFLSAEMARAQVEADLDVLDAALARLRETSTQLVGNAFRLRMAERLENVDRASRGLSYRVFGEIADPPDGSVDRLPRGVRMPDLLQRRLRITRDEVRRRFKVAARLVPRRSLTGAPLDPELPALAEAVRDGAVGEDHIREVCHALDVLPNVVPAEEKAKAERTLVTHARNEDSKFVAAVGRRIADTLNPDGLFNERDRMARRGISLGRQGPDGMSRVSGWVTPEGRAFVESVGAAVRPGHHLPDSDAVVVDAATDTRTGRQRLHDAVVLGLRAGIESGSLGTHRGIPVTVIVTTTLADLEQAARATADPSLPMPAPARTGGGSALPMRDVIRMAGNNSIHYLAVFDGHSDRPLYLGRSRRIASMDQRIICHARDKGCTRPGCTEWGYYCEVHHCPDWDPDGRTDADALFFGCGPDHKLVTDGHASTTVTPDGRLAWAVGDDPPEVNHLHHDDELLNPGRIEPGEPDGAAT